MRIPVRHFHHHTPDELIAEALLSDDAGFRTFGEIMQGRIDSDDDLTKEIERLEDELADADRKAHEACEEAVEKATAEAEDRIDGLGEQLAHERTRIAEFADENTELRKQLRRAGTSENSQAKDDATMTELRNDMTELLAAVGQTNDLLATIAEKLGAPPPDAEVAELEAPTEAPAKTATKPRSAKPRPAKPRAAKPKVAKPKPAKSETEDKAPTIDDVRAAFIAYQKEHGKGAAVGIVEDVAGTVRNLGEVPTEKYAAVIAAFEAAGQKEAA